MCKFHCKYFVNHFLINHITARKSGPQLASISVKKCNRSCLKFIVVELMIRCKSEFDFASYFYFFEGNFAFCGDAIFEFFFATFFFSSFVGFTIIECSFRLCGVGARMVAEEKLSMRKRSQ